ncbi:coagulation factor IX-like [Schistocerca americana]|uniref:coagulation factor IX-like n=1 Tax=Schistocerca americana TaxID=7009 RepID=UPI001F4F67BD|nr:coagulation factor IX-like [Schistocerca americana]
MSCLPVKEGDESVLHRQPDAKSCSCSNELCVCPFGRKKESGEICFHTEGGMECVPSVASYEDDGDAGRVDTASSQQQLPSRKKCEEIGGQPARPGGYRYVVSLELIKKDSRQFVCSGSLIASQIIVTAAHCMRQSHGRYWAIAGVVNRNVPEPAQQKRRVVEQIPHRNYYVLNNIPRNDVAVFIVYSPFIMNLYIQPINLEITPTDDLTVFVTGWGTLQDHLPAGDVLHYATAKITPRSQCLDYISDIDSRFMCATLVKGEGRSCLGDHGSGAMIGDSLTGIVSWLHTAEKEPVLVLTNVTIYKDFLTSYAN